MPIPRLERGDGETFLFSIDVPVRNEWRNVDLLRTSVQNCLKAVLADLDSCHTVAMVTGELLENALKYGDWGFGDWSMFRLRVQGTPTTIEVSVQNPVTGDDGNVDLLIKHLEWIRSFPEPDGAYRARMLEIASAEDDSDPGTDKGSRLGLARIAAEGNIELAATEDNGMLTVAAVLAVAPPKT
jgi:hypothetical protein